MTWRTAEEWLLTRFTDAPQRSKNQSAFIVGLALVLIGVADYAAGIRISLAVFYFVPILLCVAWFGSAVASGVSVLSVAIRAAGDMLAIHEHTLPIWLWWNLFSSLAVFLFVVWVFSNLLALYRLLDQRVHERTAALVESNDQRRRLEHALMSVASNERNSMGQELHDDICQHLVATTLAARVLAQCLERAGSGLVPKAEVVVGFLEQGITKTRQLAHGLLLSSIAPGELAEKLSELADEGSRSGITCTFRRSGAALVDSAETAAQLYRIAQEALRNAIRHSGGTRIRLTLQDDSSTLWLRVEDNGHGLPDPAPDSGMGMRIMAQRAAYIGATLSFDSSPDDGTAVVCRLSLDRS